MTDDQLKLKAFQLIEAGDMKMTEIVLDLGVEYPKLLKWKKELKAAKEDGTIHQLLNVGTVALETAAEQVRHDLEDLGANDDDLEAIEGELESTLAGVEGLNKLSDKVQSTAMKLTKRISGMAHTENLEVKELSLLVDSLAKIQTAFFSKPGIAILTPPGGEGTALGAFKGLLTK